MPSLIHRNVSATGVLVDEMLVDMPAELKLPGAPISTGVWTPVKADLSALLRGICRVGQRARRPGGVSPGPF